MLAFSNTTILERIITAGSSDRAAFLDALNAILVAANWESSVVATGYQYTITSPQTRPLGPLTTTVQLLAPVGQTYITAQFGTGATHRLGINSGQDYRVWVNACQLFVSTPGVTGHDPIYNTLCGGIPFVPDQTVTECWWSSGIGNTYLSLCNFRNCLAPLEYPGQAFWSACRNGEVYDCTVLQPAQQSQLRLLSPQCASYWVGLTTPPHSWFFNGAPMFVEPHIAWGIPPTIMGLLWDSVIVTKNFGVDSEQDFSSYNPDMEGLTWRQFCGDDPDWTRTPVEYWGSLFLLIEAPEAEIANVAY